MRTFSGRMCSLKRLSSMKNKKMNTKDLVDKIEKITKSRIAGQEVVSLDAFREIKKKLDPQVVLVIDDDETMRASIKRILEPEGLQVKLAADATELSQVMNDDAIDLILLDIGLPWINGFELGQMLKEHKDLKKIPLIFISGQSSEADMKQAFAIGADDFIKKPFDIDKFKKSVKVLLKFTGR